MNRILIYSSIALFTLAVSSVAFCRTWRVEKDGSGDYATIQPALDAAAPGDTVLIGPGRFTETHEVITPGSTNDVYAAVWTDSISIIGAGVDVTFIGPEAELKQGINDRPKGIFGGFDLLGGRIEDLSIENIRDGIYWDGGVTIYRCRIAGCVDAILASPSGYAMSVSSVTFQDNADHGLFAWGPCPLMSVSDCDIYGNSRGVSVVGVDSILVEHCRFYDSTVGVQYDTSRGAVRDCQFLNCVYVDVTVYGSHLVLEDCRLSSAYNALDANRWGSVQGTRNIIPPGEGERISITNTLFDFRGNHILSDGGQYIKLEGFVSQPVDTLDFSGNYWGTTVVGQIADLIWDGNDDPDIHGVVKFEPFLSEPISSEKKSLGDIKRIFR